MTTIDGSTPAVVLVCHRHVGVCITRTLGRLGVPVYGIDPYRGAPAFFSRYCRGKFIWDLHSAPAEQSVEFLRKVGRKIGRRSVLIPTSDIGAMFVAEHADQLARDFIFPRQDARLIRSLCSKKEMHRLVRRAGLDAPETAFPQSRDEVVEYLRGGARFPILLKPIYNRIPSSEIRPWRMLKVYSERELLENYERVEHPSMPNVMLQEYIPGGEDMTWTFNGYFDARGECLVAFTGRKLRNYPPYFGQASLAACADNAYVRDATIRFMKSIGYHGALDLGYRYDSRDGRYKINDINPRLGAMFRTFVGEGGVDVARALYQDLTGQPVVASAAPEGRKWMVEDVDPISSIRYWLDRNMTVRQWLASLRGVRETAFFAREDPLPLVAAYMMDIWFGLRASFELKARAADADRRLKPESARPQAETNAAITPPTSASAAGAKLSPRISHSHRGSRVSP